MRKSEGIVAQAHWVGKNMWYDECEQMRYYSVNHEPTYSALVSMPKRWATVYLPLIRK